MVAAFEKATGIKVLMTRKSSGEFYAQLKAEAANPRGDIWWGGTGDPHLQAAEEGLTEAYKSPKHGRAAGLGGAAGGAVEGPHGRRLRRRARLQLQHRAAKKKNMPEPKCWADLIKPEFKDEIQVANPNSSGTSYTMLATLVQLMGEDKAFEYLKALHKNVNQYTKSGAAPARAAATGETLVGITFHARRGRAGGRRRAGQDRRALRRHRLRDRQHEHHQGREEHGERQEVVRLGAHAGGAGDRRAGEGRTRCRRTRTRTAPPQAPKLSEIKLINYDFAKYGSSARAHAPADEVGQGGLRAAEVTRRAARVAVAAAARWRRRALRAGGARPRDRTR